MGSCAGASTYSYNRCRHGSNFEDTWSAGYHWILYLSSSTLGYTTGDLAFEEFIATDIPIANGYTIGSAPYDQWNRRMKVTITTGL